MHEFDMHHGGMLAKHSYDTIRIDPLFTGFPLLFERTWNSCIFFTNF